MSIADNTKVSDKLNYHQLQTTAPKYIYRNVYPANGGARNISMTSAGEVVNTIFQVPCEVVNLGESYLEYQMVIPAQGAGNYGWRFDDVHGEFDQVLYRDTGTMNIVELRFANLYQHVMNRINTTAKELQHHSVTNGIRVTNALTSVQPDAAHFDGTQTYLSYVEPRHLEVSAVNANLVRTKRVYLKELCKDSFFGLAKNSILPVETYLDINFTGNRIGFLGTSATDPTAGNAALAVATQLNGLVLKLAVETNQEIINALKKEVGENGMSYPIPWVKVHTLVSNSAAPYVYNLALDNSQHGRKIKKIVYAPFKANVAANDSKSLYDHTNVGGSKLAQYQTELDNQKLQRDYVNVSDGPNFYADDYMQHKGLLLNTTYYNQDMYRFNWFHMDAFDFDQCNHNKDGSILVDGYDLVKPVTWTMNVLTGSGSVVNSVAIVLGQKLLQINASSYLVS